MKIVIKWICCSNLRCCNYSTHHAINQTLNYIQRSKKEHYASCSRYTAFSFHDDVIKWKHFRVLLALFEGNPPVTGSSPHKGQWCRALMSSLICAWIYGWVNNQDAGDLRRYRADYDVTLMSLQLANCGVLFVSEMSDRRFSIVIAVLCVLSC